MGKKHVLLRHLGSMEKNKLMFAVYIYENLYIHNHRWDTIEQGQETY